MDGLFVDAKGSKIFGNQCAHVSHENVICSRCALKVAKSMIDGFFVIDTNDKITKNSMQPGNLWRMGNSNLELRELLEQRPPCFSTSMLSSHQKQALEDVRAAEEGATLEAEAERLKVRDARWTWFQHALERDQAILRQIGSAPEKIQALRHRKQMAWRLIQARNGEKLVKSYMDKFLRADIVPKVELAQQKINEFRSFVVA